jgi:hypothetical protein
MFFAVNKGKTVAIFYERTIFMDTMSIKMKVAFVVLYGYNV